MRPYIVAGGAMRWHPDRVRATFMSDFSAAFEGYQLDKGIAQTGLDDDEINDLKALMAKEQTEFPNGRRTTIH